MQSHRMSAKEPGRYCPCPWSSQPQGRYVMAMLRRRELLDKECDDLVVDDCGAKAEMMTEDAV